jgi:galactoside O-acetyltransferase
VDNLFFDLGLLKHCGRGAIIGKTVRIRYPELVSIGEGSIIDDFTYISTALEIADRTHISAGCKLIGGRSATVRMGELSTLAPNVVLSAGSDDYVGGLATPLVPADLKGNYEVGTIDIGRHCIVGAGTVVLPNVVLGEGSAVGALSLVKADLEPWSLYAGIPARRLKDRDREGILALDAELRRRG